MEDKKKRFESACHMRGSIIMWYAGAAVPPLSFLKDVSNNERHFTELAAQREKVIDDMYLCRNELWNLIHTEGYKTHDEKFLMNYGKDTMQRADVFY